MSDIGLTIIAKRLNEDLQHALATNNLCTRRQIMQHLYNLIGEEIADLMEVDECE